MEDKSKKFKLKGIMGDIIISLVMSFIPLLFNESNIKNTLIKFIIFFLIFRIRTIILLKLRD